MSYQLTVVCTDRGAHRTRTLARLSIGNHDGRVVIGRQGRTHVHTHDGRFVAPPSTSGAADARKRDDGGVTFTFTCPTCGRNVAVRDDNLANLAEVGDNGQRWSWVVSTLDISHPRT